MRVGEGEPRGQADITQALDLSLHATAAATVAVRDQDPEIGPLCQAVVHRHEGRILDGAPPLGVRNGFRPAVGSVEVLPQRSEADRQRPRMEVSLLDEAPDRELG